MRRWALLLSTRHSVSKQRAFFLNLRFPLPMQSWFGIPRSACCRSVFSLSYPYICDRNLPLIVLQALLWMSSL